MPGSREVTALGDELLLTLRIPVRTQALDAFAVLVRDLQTGLWHGALWQRGRRDRSHPRWPGPAEAAYGYQCSLAGFKSRAGALHFAAQCIPLRHRRGIASPHGGAAPPGVMAEMPLAAGALEAATVPEHTGNAPLPKRRGSSSIPIADSR